MTMTERRYTPENIRELGPGEVFVFGSNLSGMHGGGAAPLFKDAAGMANVILPRTFADILSR